MNLSVKAARTITSVTLTDCKPTLEEFIAVVKFGAKLEFSNQMKEAVQANRRLLEKFLEEGRVIYGVTTGFGETSATPSPLRMPPPYRKTLSVPTL